jgi:CAAX protease family protein
MTDATRSLDSAGPGTSQLRTFFSLAFGLTWGIGGIALLIGLWMPESRPLSTSSPVYYLAGYAVSLSGIGLTALWTGRQGLRHLGSRLVPWRSPLRWYLIVVVGYAFVSVISLWIAALLRSTPVTTSPWPWSLTALIGVIARDPGPLGEELGWRGFALPRLLEGHSPLPASIRLGLVHTAWHLPLFFIPGMPQTHVSFPLFAVGVVAIAIIDTALYLRTEANLLLAILVHALANLCGGLAADAQALNTFLVFEGIAATVVVIVGGLRPAEPPATADCANRRNRQEAAAPGAKNSHADATVVD